MAVIIEVGQQSETTRSLLRPLMRTHPANFYPVVLACSGSKVGVDPPRRETSIIPMAERVWLRPLQAGKSGNYAP